MGSSGKSKLDALTSARFIAAVLIVIWHMRGHFGIPAQLGQKSWFLAHGVSFFFVLSGFILMYVYPQLEGTSARLRFLLARFARIWPAHLLALVAAAVLVSHQQLDWKLPTLAKWGASLSMVHVWLPNHIKVYYFLNAPAWSISAEFFFYLAFIALVPNFRTSWVWKLGLAFTLGLLVCAICQDGHLPWFPEINAHGLTYHSPITRVFEFVMGMCFGLLFQQIQHINLGVWKATGVEVAALLLMAGAAYLTHQWGHEKSWLAATVGATTAKWQSWGAGAAPAFGLMIVALAMGQGLISRLLAAPVLVLLGEVSYSIYLFHGLLLALYRQHAKAFEGWSNTSLIVVFGLVLLLVSHLVFVAWERPMRSAILALCLRKRKDRKPAAEQVPSPAFDFWQFLTAPNWKFVTVELAVALLMTFQLYQYATRPDYLLIDGQTANLYAANDHLPEPAIEYNDRFILRSATYLPAEGGFRVRLVWESKQDQRLDNYVCLHLLDANQSRCTQIGCQQDVRGRKIRKGAIWEHEMFVPRKAVEPKVTSLAIGLWHPKRGSLPCLQANADRERWRVFLPPPTEQLARQAASDVILR